ncbi:hypothetical protein OMAG_000231, partial [Candidatus Omnitrophus magneticus]
GLRTLKEFQKMNLGTKVIVVPAIEDHDNVEEATGSRWLGSSQ